MAQDTFNWSLDLVKVAEAVINKLDKNKSGGAFLLRLCHNKWLIFDEK